MSAKRVAKFTRSANFSTYEEELLLTLVKKYKNIIECKTTDGAMGTQKNSAWENLAKEFNCNSGEQYRSVDILRRKYDNIKKRAKQKYADEKIKVMGTGGGPYKEVKMSKIDLEVKQILGSSMTGLHSKLDDDCEYHMEMEDYTCNAENTEEITMGEDGESQEKETEIFTAVDQAESVNYEIITLQPEINEEPNWSSYTPKMLKTKKSQALQVTPKNSREDRTGKALENKLVSWTTAKLELVDFQKKFYEEEHSLKLKNIRDKHEREIEREEREANVRIRAIEEEHRVKMELLELQKRKYINGTKQ